MPQLRSLRFTLALLEGCGDRVLIWPPDVDPPRTRTLPLLEALAVSYPSSQDRLYSHLPSSLRTLSLEYFSPCASHALGTARQLHDDDMGRSTPALPSSEILAILRRCPTSSMRSLSVDYHVDGEEDALLAHIAAALPDLETVQLRRYRAREMQESMEDCATRVARALAPLARLTTLRVHLDVVPSLPLITGCFGSLLIDPITMEAYHASLRVLVDLMIPILSPTLRTVGMFVPSSYPKIALLWAAFRVLRPGGRDWDDGDYGDSSGHGFGLVLDDQWENEGHWEDDPENDHWWRYS